jgi:hypothetical protein
MSRTKRTGAQIATATAPGREVREHFRANHHQTVSVRVGPLSARIDEKIADLVRELWRADINTVCSCEDVGDAGEAHRHGPVPRYGADWAGWVHVVFETTDDALEFLRRVTRFERGKRGLYNRISHRDIRGEGVNYWIYELLPIEYALPPLERRAPRCARREPGFLVSIYFPRSDVPVLVERLRESNSP